MTVDPFNLAPHIEHILGRATIKGDCSGAYETLAGQRILVTGAGGSIGSALSEVLASLHPAALTLLEHHENSLFQLRQHLLNHTPYGDGPLHFVLADIRNRRRMATVLREHMPDVIFHLAAYKHVHLAEESPEEFISINVLGTWHLLQEACRQDVKKVVYPSTDKAVNPPSIYGATKRTVEILIQTLAAAEPCSSLTAVRLVNVLGAQGGVIETFARQISQQMVPTVTDAAMTRYWITMQEAIYLLTQASVAGKSGSILILDLGDPIKVLDIARKLWRILGPQEREFEVRIVGMRPGERIAEYLCTEEEYLVASGIQGLLEVKSKVPACCQMAAAQELVGALDEMIDVGDDAGLRDCLFSFVREHS